MADVGHDDWDKRNYTERVLDHLGQVRDVMQRAVRGRFNRRQAEVTLARIDALVEELNATALISAPAGISRITLPEGVWLYIPDHDRAPRGH
jgi:hypothetical protein